MQLGTEERWTNAIESRHFSKEKMNKLLLNYFCIYGYKEAAEALSRESGIPFG